jgi:excisionase family DNA binding protein
VPNDQTTTPAPAVAANGVELLLLSAAGVARVLGVSRSKIYTMHAAGQLPLPVQFGGSVRWRVSDLKLWTELSCPNRQRFEALKAEAGR